MEVPSERCVEKTGGRWNDARGGHARVDQWEFRLAVRPSTEIAGQGGMAAAGQGGMDDLEAKGEHAPTVLAEMVYFDHGATEQGNAISLLRTATLAPTSRARESTEISLNIDRGRHKVSEAVDAGNAEAHEKLIMVLPTRKQDRAAPQALADRS